MPSIHLRMSEEQHAELQRSARAAGRSMQAELEWRAFAHYSATRLFDPTQQGISVASTAYDPEGLRLLPIPETLPEPAGSLGEDPAFMEEITQAVMQAIEEPGNPSSRLEAGVDESADRSGRASGAGETIGGDSGGVPTGVAATPASSRGAPAPSVPPAPVAPARSPRSKRPKNGPCEHRVPEGTYCKVCGA